MSLIKCPECNNTISSEALSCPNCGYILKDNDKQIDYVSDKTNSNPFAKLLDAFKRGFSFLIRIPILGPIICFILSIAFAIGLVALIILIYQTLSSIHSGFEFLFFGLCLGIISFIGLKNGNGRKNWFWVVGVICTVIILAMGIFVSFSH